MKILITNDDGYQAKGIRILTEIMKDFGELTVVAPKRPQSGMSMAVTMGLKPIGVKKIEDSPGLGRWYLDATPASCVKYGIDNIFWPGKPDLVVSGINHGSNAATAAVYSGTIGAAMEAAVNGIPGIGVSLDSYGEDADFSAVEELLPGILETLLPLLKDSPFGAFCNINFPKLPASGIKGVKAGHMGMAHWEREFRKYPDFLCGLGRSPAEEDLLYCERARSEGEELLVMAGDFVSNVDNVAGADHLLLEEGWISVTPQNIDNTDFNELKRICDTIL